MPKKEKEGTKRAWIPNALWKKIEKIIQDHPEQGYTSVSQFVIDATRRRIEELEEKGLFS